MPEHGNLIATATLESQGIRQFGNPIHGADPNLKDKQFALIDCQVASAHTLSLGATNIRRAEFLQLIEQLCRPAGVPARWR